MLLTSRYPNASAASTLLLDADFPAVQPPWNNRPSITSKWSEPQIELPPAAEIQARPQPRPDEIDPLYLFSCHLAWEQEQEPSAGWELLAAAQSLNPETRAHARGLLAHSRHFGGLSQGAAACRVAKQKRSFDMETDMAPYGLEIIDDCRECQLATHGFFADFPRRPCRR